MALPIEGTPNPWNSGLGGPAIHGLGVPEIFLIIGVLSLISEPVGVLTAPNMTNSYVEISISRFHCHGAERPRKVTLNVGPLG